MKTVKQFSIPFTGLKPGKHDFNFEIDDAFFSEFEYSLVKSGKINLQLEFDKQQDMMFVLNFHFSGQVKLICERCLDEYIYDLTADERLIVRTGDEEFDDPEIMTIGRHVHEIDLSALIYEYINLALPLIHQHALDEDGEPACNNDTAEVLRKLTGLQHTAGSSDPDDNAASDEAANSGALNGNPGAGEIATDPRWEALKNLKNNKA